MTKNPPLVPESLTQAHYALVGEVANAWNLAQYGVYCLFETVTGAQASWEMFWAMKTDAAQRDVMLAAAKIFLDDEPEIYERLKSSTKKLHNLAGQRNAAIHTPWGVTFSNLEILDPTQWEPKMTPLRGAPLLREDFADQFRSLIEELNEISHTLWEVDHQLREKLASLETDPRPRPLPRSDPEAARRETSRGEILIRHPSSPG